MYYDDDYGYDDGYGDYLACRAEDGEAHCEDHGFYDMTPAGEKDRWGCPAYFDDPGCPDCKARDAMFEQVRAGEVDPSMICFACEAEVSATSFMAQRVCMPCYGAIAKGEVKMDRLTFADPGGHSALRASGPGNPRVHPCPTCYEPNRLTPQDVQRGYQCDTCADRAEGRYFGGDY
jgi:hypothetical protein